jgi:chemotaxis protein histidine kinase CheA
MITSHDKMSIESGIELNNNNENHKKASERTEAETQSSLSPTRRRYHHLSQSLLKTRIRRFVEMITFSKFNRGIRKLGRFTKSVFSI